MTPTAPPPPTITPTELPACSELTINSNEVSFDPGNAQPGDIVTVSAIVRNTGFQDVDSTTVYFAYELTPLDPGDDPNPMLIGEPVPLMDILRSESRVASVQWDTTGMEATTYPVYVMTFGTTPEECDPYNYTQVDFIVPVTLLSFETVSRDQSVRLDWVTTTEINNIGFDLHRSTTYPGQFTRINSERIPGAGMSFTRKDYSWTDTAVINDTPYFYRLVTISGDGTLGWSKTVAAVPNSSGIAVEIKTEADRHLYSEGQRLQLNVHAVNPGSEAQVELAMILMVDGTSSYDLISPVSVSIPSSLDYRGLLIEHTFQGVEPDGDYSVITTVRNPQTGSLVYLDVSEFRFLRRN